MTTDSPELITADVLVSEDVTNIRKDTSRRSARLMSWVLGERPETIRTQAIVDKVNAILEARPNEDDLDEWGGDPIKQAIIAQLFDEGDEWDLPWTNYRFLPGDSAEVYFWHPYDSSTGTDVIAAAAAAIDERLSVEDILPCRGMSLQDVVDEICGRHVVLLEREGPLVKLQPTFANRLTGWLRLLWNLLPITSAVGLCILLYDFIEPRYDGLSVFGIAIVFFIGWYVVDTKWSALSAVWERITNLVFRHPS